jgi:hypothetical protein
MKSSPRRATDSGSPPTRLAAPPALFLGREEDLGFAKLALARRRVLVVWGLGGLGKSALLRAVVQSDTERAGTVELRARRGAGLREIADALRTSSGESPAKDDEALALAIVDLADRRGATLLLDDAHHMAPAAFAELMQAFAAHATRATLLASTRERPEVPDLAEQLLLLRPLRAESIEELVRACRPDMSADARGKVVARAAGSPWLARCLVAGADSGTTTRLTDDLDGPARRALGALRWIEAPVPEASGEATAPR